MTITERLKSYEPLWENWYYEGYISSGASGAVYKFKQNRFGETVYSAVKVISINAENEINLQSKELLMTSIRKRAEEEIENMYSLNDCPNIVHCNNHAIKNVVDEKGNIVAVDILIQMDLYTCLVNYLAENDELSEIEVIKLADNIGTALKYAHNIGIIHRDIKPSNIFINSKGEFLLGDLGVSKRLGTDSYMTRTGTEPYIAPEVWRSNGVDAYTTSADIYSLGIVLYMLMNNNYLPLVSECSSVAETQKAIVDRISGAEFNAPENGCDEFKKVIMKSCAYDVGIRYKDVSEFLVDLKHAYVSFDENVKPWIYKNDGTLIINKFDNDDYKEYISDVSKVVISEGISIIPIKAFKGFQVKSVELPYSIKIIEKEAFWGCKLLEQIAFEKCYCLEKIGKKAFSMCISLGCIDLSFCKKLKLIDDKAFWYCKSLLSVNLPEKSFVKISETAFKDCDYKVVEKNLENI